MSETSQGVGWWQASDGKWYAPELHPEHPENRPAARPLPSPVPGAPGVGTQPGQTAIIVTTRIFPLAFLLLLFKTRIVIDGTLTQQKWGSHLFPVAPGTHRVVVSFDYIFGEVGKNEVTVEVATDQTVEVNYRAPFIVFLKGKIRVG